jgi:hypothetical protein
MADTNLKKALDESGCNRLEKHCILGQSIGHLKQFLALYNGAKHSGGKNRKHRKKTQKKTQKKSP